MPSGNTGTNEGSRLSPEELRRRQSDGGKKGMAIRHEKKRRRKRSRHASNDSNATDSTVTLVNTDTHARMPTTTLVSNLLKKGPLRSCFHTSPCPHFEDSRLAHHGVDSSTLEQFRLVRCGLSWEYDGERMLVISAWLPDPEHVRRLKNKSNTQEKWVVTQGILFGWRESATMFNRTAAEEGIQNSDIRSISETLIFQCCGGFYDCTGETLRAWVRKEGKEMVSVR